MVLRISLQQRKIKASLLFGFYLRFRRWIFFFNLFSIAMDYDSADNCVTFIWKIDNFSHCTQKNGACLTSPIFIVEGCSFTVDLYLRGTVRKGDCVGLRLYRRNCPNNFPSISFVFSILAVKGSFENSKVNNVQSCPGKINSQGTHSEELLLTVPDILKKRVMHSITDGDTLTIKCKIVKWRDASIKYNKIFNACTVINVKKTTYSWNVKTFICTKEKKIDQELNLYDAFSFTIDVSWVNSDRDLIEILIRRTKANEPNSSSCTLSLLDKEKVLQSVRHEHWFENKQDIEHVWNISFVPKRQLVSYPQKDTYFRLEFEVSKGIEYSGIREIQHGTSIEHQPSSYYPAASVSSICTQTPAVSVSSIFTQTPSESFKLWKDNLQHFYADGTLSDVTIRTPTKEFPVHKALLCAQSEVFTAMFERNMKEKETGVIDINDSNDETISKMLLYIYGGLVENLDWESALNLYSAAHKYRIAALCEQCLDFLKDHLSTLNFYECLHIADLYQDQLLKSVAQEFVMKHSNEVINSEEWTEFMKVNVSLAAETMRMCFKNSKNP